MTTTSINNPMLQTGSQGAAVKTLQELLNRRVSRDYRVSVDGKFDANTKRAVEIFQYSKLLRRDGIVGEKTWKALQTNTPADMPIIRSGSKGEAVSIAQDILKGGGYYKGTVDSNFGTQTEMAVRAFQTDSIGFQNDGKLTVDGIVGKKTWATLSNFATYLAFD